MKWDEAQDLLSSGTTSVFQNIYGTQDYSGISILPTFYEVLYPDTIWFAAISDWVKMPDPIREKITFILYSDIQSAHNMIPDNINCALFDDISEWESYYNILTSEFNAVYLVKQGILELISMTTKNIGFHQIANKISEIFGVPTSIIDNSFSFIAVSDDFINVPVIKEFEAGYLSQEAQELILNGDFMFPREMRESTVYWDHQFKDGKSIRNYLTLIYFKNMQMGSFSLITTPDKPISKCRTNTLPVIAKILSLEMQKSDFYVLNKATFFSHILTQLLDPIRKFDEESIQKRLMLFGYLLKKYKYIIYIDFIDEDFDIQQIQAFAEQFRASIPNSFYMIHEKNIMYIKSTDDDNVISDEETSNWIKIIAHSKLKIGISSIFEDISQVRFHLKQARSAIETGRKFQPETSVYSFDAFRLADMVAHMPDDIDFYYYCYPPMRRLIERDITNGTNLAYTLYKYLENPANPSQICKDLFIHKNTLYYRLDKIREIMKSDLREANVVAQIQLTFQIFKYKNRFADLIERKPE